MPSLKHFHTYERSKRHKHIFRCVHPECTHFTHLDNIRGKKAHCKCDAIFILETTINRKGFLRKELKCPKCRGEKIQVDVAATAIMDEILRPKLTQQGMLEELETEMNLVLESSIESESLIEEDD